jgi:hypothetical protein
MNKHPERIQLKIKDGVALIGMDAHIWHKKMTPAFLTFGQFADDLKPKAIILNGDIIDASTISRHPPIGWESHPTLAQELSAATDQLNWLATMASGNTTRQIWTLGNHDARFETRLATVAPEYEQIKGVHLKDHFPSWEPAWSVEINKDVIVKHRFKGGQNAALNNARDGGRSIVTGHFHRLGITPYSDYNGTRFGIEGGMLGDPRGPQFTGYTEDNPLNWRSGFVVLTFVNGRLLWPEVVSVSNRGFYEWRGKRLKV